MLADAYLALADDGLERDQRTLRRTLAAAVAAVILALGIPLGFLTTKPHEPPVAALSSKLTLDDEAPA